MRMFSLGNGNAAVRMAAMAVGLVVWGCGDNSPMNTGAADMAAASGDMAMADPVAQGQKLTMMFGCVACHQSANAADGTLSGSTMARPMSMSFSSNLTPDKATGIGDWTKEQIITAIRTGVAVGGRTLCPQMPRYAMLKDDQVNAIVAYLNSLPPVAHQIPMSMCPATDGGMHD